MNQKYIILNQCFTFFGIPGIICGAFLSIYKGFIRFSHAFLRKEKKLFFISTTIH